MKNEVIAICFTLLLLILVETRKKISLTKKPRHRHEYLPFSAHKMCLTGKNQTPIDFNTKKILTRMKNSNLEVKYAPTLTGVLSWYHHTWKMKLDKNNGNHVMFFNKEKNKFIKYTLLQFHMHIPSEHTFDGEEVDAEYHFVHKTDEPVQKNLLVLGIMAKKVSSVPRGTENVFGGLVLNKKSTIKDFDKLFKGKQFYHYDGSLTTPPCNESVNWFILKDVKPILEKQIEEMTSIMETKTKHRHFNRPTTPLNGRKVYLTTSK